MITSGDRWEGCGMARHSRVTPRRRVWPLLTGTLAAAIAVGLIGWTITGAAGRPLTELIARTATPTPGPTPSRAELTAEPTVADPDASPLAGHQLWIEPDGSAAQQARIWEAEGRTADAAAIRRIAAQPQAVWFTADTGGFAARATTIVTAAERAGKLPVLVAYHLPRGGCDGRSTRAATDAATDEGAYGAWITALAEGLAGHAAVVVLEPDGVAEAVDGCLRDADAVAERYRMLAAAIDTLKVNSGVRVYLDAGNPSWITDTRRLAAALK